ncbi:hypothetical protein PR048_001429 [Dryococelus australis]|uniref:Uncharacterized protein n=1 Tax=Dryococelus australis TaxID=614101 RepID=A0ABQ9IHB9_9NEOP|nr:hypothetical protein PR048_001429 [Dryococelus australis]
MPGPANMLLQQFQGTDITEAFEAHHINAKTEVLLKKFHVQKATTPRNSPYTFHENGFYKTLKRRVREVLGNNYSGPSVRSIIITDSFVAATLWFSVQAAATGSYYLAMVAGVFLCYTGISSHNFFHQKNNFRMHYFDLTLMSSRVYIDNSIIDNFVPVHKKNLKAQQFFYILMHANMLRSADAYSTGDFIPSMSDLSSGTSHNSGKLNKHYEQSDTKN